MKPDLRHRETDLRERMDEPGCDERRLNRTYARFAGVNRLVAGWRRTYRSGIRPLLSAQTTIRLLDIGSGGGDVPRALHAWARADGLRLEVDAIDPDPRAYAFATAQPAASGLLFRRADASELVAAAEHFDIVTSNHLLHHLDAVALTSLLHDSERLASQVVLHSDLRRSRAAYLGWAIASLPAARDSFLRTDGLLSIRRSYVPAELVRVLPPGWRVERQPPFRLLLIREQSAYAERT